MRPLERWLAFVYRQLRSNPGTYLAADDLLWVSFHSADGQQHELGYPPQRVERLTEEGIIIGSGYPQADKLPGRVERWKISQLAADVFTASVVAIDMLLADPDPEGPFLVSWSQMDANQKSPAYQNSNFRVDSIRLGEGREFPVYREWCNPAPGRTPSICPNADPPTDQADRRALWNICRKSLNSFVACGFIKDDQTIHWVGRQAKLGSVCKCDLTEEPNARADRPRSRRQTLKRKAY